MRDKCTKTINTRDNIFCNVRRAMYDTDKILGFPTENGLHKEQEVFRGMLIDFIALCRVICVSFELSPHYRFRGGRNRNKPESNVQRARPPSEPILQKTGSHVWGDVCGHDGRWVHARADHKVDRRRLPAASCRRRPLNLKALNTKRERRAYRITTRIGETQ